MKTLHLMRHAKSSWKEAGLDDHDRDLNKRGRRDAPAMGAALLEQVAPQPIYCSSALRARRTLEGLCRGFPDMAAQPHHIDDRLYQFDFAAVLGWLQEWDGDAQECFLIGHNPAFTDLCNQLAGRRAIDNLPTAGYLRLELSVDYWREAAEGRGELVAWCFPRDLR